jgi:hypothetical protein
MQRAFYCRLVFSSCVSRLVLRTQDVWGAEGISGRVKFLLLAWAGMPKTSFRKNSDSPLGCSGLLPRVLILSFTVKPVHAGSALLFNFSIPPYKQQPNISPLFWLLIRTGQIQLGIQNFALIRLS